MEFAQPPMALHMPPPNLSGPPPNLSMPPPPGPPPQHYGNYNQRGGFNQRPPFRPFLNMNRSLPGPLGNMTLEDFDGKRLRKSVMRKTVDYNSAIIKELETRTWQRDYRDRRALQPDVMYYPDLAPPPSYPDNPINCVTTRFVKTATNKMRCPIFCMAWTPEGRRLVTGASSGEFTLWNGLTFNFETILQAHDSPVRTMVWSHNDNWMVTGDHAGYVKYWQSNMNNVKMFQAHKEALRGISFSPTDSKFVTCSDDGTLRIWDFYRYQEERILRGHGADVKCVHWHPQKGLIISGSKDNQQPIKLWDPKTGNSLATLHAHKSTVMDLKWNDNGNWLITASRDHLLKLFDLRNLNQEVQVFRGHKKEASSVAWHPNHEGLFSSGGSDGSIMFWHVGADKEVGAIEQAHDSIVWTLAWHPLGHILCSGSNDHTSKFWTRNRPGDQMRDKYNLNTLPAGIAGLDDADLDEPSMIPGMGPEDKVEYSLPLGDGCMTIPGLDLDSVSNAEDRKMLKKVPYSKPIPRNFQAQWNETGEDDSAFSDVLAQIVENTPGVVPLQKITPNALIMYGKVIPVEPGSKLEAAIAEGPESLKRFIHSGQIEELADMIPQHEGESPASTDHDYLNDAYIDDSDDEHAQVTGAHPPKDDITTRFPDKNDADMRLQQLQQQKQQQQQQQMAMGDMDMRRLDGGGLFGNSGDIDLRDRGRGDMDLRAQGQGHPRMFENEEEYRKYRDQQDFNQRQNNYDYSHDIDDDDDMMNDGNYFEFNKFNNGGGPPMPPPMRGFHNNHFGARNGGNFPPRGGMMPPRGQFRAPPGLGGGPPDGLGDGNLNMNFRPPMHGRGRGGPPRFGPPRGMMRGGMVMPPPPPMIRGGPRGGRY